MRTAFRLFLIVLFLGLVTPLAVGAVFWTDQAGVIARAEASGILRQPNTHLTTAERTIVLDQFSETWGRRAYPCRTIDLLWTDFTAPDIVVARAPVSQRLARALTPQQSIRSRVSGIVIACQLEQRFSDVQLLRAWLTSAYFGQNAVGIENAAQGIFGKPSRDLDADDSAKLAALLRTPGLRNQPDRWAQRAQAISARIAPHP